MLLYHTKERGILYCARNWIKLDRYTMYDTWTTAIFERQMCYIGYWIIQFWVSPILKIGLSILYLCLSLCFEDFLWYRIKTLSVRWSLSQYIHIYIYQTWRPPTIYVLGPNVDEIALRFRVRSIAATSHHIAHILQQFFQKRIDLFQWQWSFQRLLFASMIISVFFLLFYSFRPDIVRILGIHNFPEVIYCPARYQNLSYPTFCWTEDRWMLRIFAVFGSSKE